MLAQIHRIIKRYITRNRFAPRSPSAFSASRRPPRRDNTSGGKIPSAGWVEIVDRFGLRRLEWQVA